MGTKNNAYVSISSWVTGLLGCGVVKTNHSNMVTDWQLRWYLQEERKYPHLIQVTLPWNAHLCHFAELIRFPTDKHHSWGDWVAIYSTAYYLTYSNKHMYYSISRRQTLP